MLLKKDLENTIQEIQQKTPMVSREEIIKTALLTYNWVVDQYIKGNKVVGVPDDNPSLKLPADAPPVRPMLRLIKS